jgi:LacI family transcriptional regulator
MKKMQDCRLMNPCLFTTAYPARWNKCNKKTYAKPKKPDAIFCANDTTALSAIIYLREKGIKVPQDILIVGFSNEPFSEVVTPSISTIRQPGFEMGQKAAELLIAEIKSKGTSRPFKKLLCLQN